MRSRLFAACVLLGFASGLPNLLITDVLKLRLAACGLDPATIGLFGLIALPYALKPLWAPLLDRFAPPQGRRRGWLLLCQIVLVPLLASLGSVPVVGGLPPLLVVLALAAAWASATQDIAGDAWRADASAERERGPMAAAWVLAYRAALLAGGALAPKWAAHLGWSATYGLLAGMLLVGVGGAVLAREPVAEAAPTSLTAAVALPFADLLRRYRQHLVALLTFVLLFRFADGLLGSQGVVFLQKHDYTLDQIGDMRGGLGLAATLVGTALGGALLPVLGWRRALLLFGLLQAGSNLAYAWLAGRPADAGDLAIAVTIENLCGGLAGPALVAYLMGCCAPAFSATQYALLTAVISLGRDIIPAPAGFLVEHLGWPAFFAATALAGLPVLLLLPLLPAPLPAPQPATG